MSNFIRPLNPITTGHSASPIKRSASNKQEASFQQVLSQTMAQTAQRAQGLTFSKHAEQRTLQRGIALEEADMNRLNQAVEKAEDKGLSDTLVFMNNTAFIVNVPNRVIVTVLQSDDAQNTVFTNIDGAVIV